jgi:hypothetical protein
VVPPAAMAPVSGTLVGVVELASSSMDVAAAWRYGRPDAATLHRQGAVTWPGRFQEDILPSIQAGEQARVRLDLPLKLVISDSDQAIIPFSLAPGGQSAAYQIHRSPMLVALESLFEALWKRGEPLPGRPHGHPVWPALRASSIRRPPGVSGSPGGRPELRVSGRERGWAVFRRRAEERHRAGPRRSGLPWRA